MKRDTVGKLSTDLLQDADYLTHSPHEQMQKQLENYEELFYETFDDGRKVYEGDFYIVVETKKERLMKNVIRNYFFHRKSCPTPTYDNVVYRYNFKDDYIEILWVLPSRDTYNMMINRAVEIPKEQYELLQYVLDDRDGTLLNICKQLNGELN